MTIEEFRTLMEDTLTPLGLEVGNVEISPDRSQKNLEIWAHSGCHYYVSPLFLQLPEAEAKFGILHEVGLPPSPQPTEGKIQLGLLIVFLLHSILYFFLNDSFVTERRVMLAPILLLSLWMGRNARLSEAKRLEQNVYRAGDAIAARTYLEKVAGQIFPKRILSPKYWFRQHPIRNYLQYGTDERLKAILKSDLVHPSTGGSAT